MSFIRIGHGCFRKSKIVCLEVAVHSSTRFFKLRIMYDEPRALAGLLRYNPNLSTPMIDFDIIYGPNAMSSVVRDVQAIIAGNPRCLLDESVSELLEHHKKRQSNRE